MPYKQPLAVRAENSGRPSCSLCSAPMRWNRIGVCPSCYRDDYNARFTLKKKETEPCPPPLPSTPLTEKSST
jgi:hypothetical protein